MGTTLVLFFLFMLILAAFTSDPIVFHLIYLFGGAYLLGVIGSSRALAGIHFNREFIRYGFPGETIQVNLLLENRNQLPLLWLSIQELLPLEISSFSKISEVISLAGRDKHKITYSLKLSRRGVFPVGPFRYSSGDIFGFSTEKVIESKEDSLIVFPRVYFPNSFVLPSHSPFGVFRHNQQIFYDPCRIRGKREYRTGDSLKQIDWKSSSKSEKLQVKLFEPSISSDTFIFLNLNANEYPLKFRYQASELAVSLAASIATWCIRNKLPAGLVNNGQIKIKEKELTGYLPSKKGSSHLINLLTLLAQIECAETNPFQELFHTYRTRLPWGSTAVIITHQANLDLFNEIIFAQKAGVKVFLFMCGEGSNFGSAKETAEKLGVEVLIIRNENDLKFRLGAV